jgi:hypothetical protein
MNKNATIFQCEMFAILKSAEWINKHKKYENIYILSDSQSSLKALNKSYTKSSITMNTLNELNKGSKTNNITLLKVPAHTGLRGNDRADLLAKLGTTRSEITHKVRRSVNSAIFELKENLHKEHITRLKGSDISDKAKIPITTMLKKYKYNINIPTRRSLTRVTQIISSTSILNYSRSVRVKDRNPFCPYCKNIRETSEHFLTTCPKLANARTQCFGRNKITIKEIINERTLSDITEYITDSKRFMKKINNQEGASSSITKS